MVAPEARKWRRGRLSSAPGHRCGPSGPRGVRPGACGL